MDSKAIFATVLAQVPLVKWKTCANCNSKKVVSPGKSTASICSDDCALEYHEYQQELWRDQMCRRKF